MVLTIRKRSAWFLVMVSAVLASVLLAGFYLAPNFKARVFATFSSYRELVENDDQLSSVALHFKSWHCAPEESRRMRIVFGNGTGDEKDLLRNCYGRNSWTEIQQVGYDAHNEFLSSLVRQGLVGLLLLMATLGYAGYIALKSDDVLYLSFVVLIAVAAISESILKGQTGLLFFAFFNALLFKRCYLNKQV